MPGRRGPIGGLIGLIGSGVGAAAEYHEHRKVQKLSRENSSQEVEVVAGPSSMPHQQQQQQARRAPPASPSEQPPSYAELEAGSIDRSLSRDAPNSDEKEGALCADQSDDSDSDSDLETLEDDSEDWELDEALDEPDSRNPPSYDESEAQFRTTDELVQDVLLTSRAAATITQQTPIKVRYPLPCPVILPQRRPRNKARGFVRAYAPVLADTGIDQETFMTFLKNFHKASQASPIFPVIQVSAGIAGFAPSVIAMAVTTAVQVAAGIGQEVQARQRTNEFLEEMNERLFKPAGVYALIMKYKSADAENSSSRTDIGARFGLRPQVVDMSTNQVVARYDRSASEGTSSRTLGDRMKDLRLASGTTQGAIQLPEAAPLIFPDIDRAVARDGAEETFKDRAKDAHKFLGDYLDRRAQMQYARDDHTSHLALPEEQRAFKSKLVDPNHPAFQSGLVGLVSGGVLSPRQERKSGRRFEKRERKALRYEQRMDRGRDLSSKKQRRYDAFMGEMERRSGPGGRLGSLGGHRYDDHVYNDQQACGRQRRGGRRGGLISGLIGVAVDAASNRSNDSEPPAPHGGSQSASANLPTLDGSSPGSRSREYEDLHSDRTASSDNGRYRRSFDDRRGGGGGPVGMVKRLMREDVLYLTIVNLPSEAELAEARAELQRQTGRST